MKYKKTQRRRTQKRKTQKKRTQRRTQKRRTQKRRTQKRRTQKKRIKKNKKFKQRGGSGKSAAPMEMTQMDHPDEGVPPERMDVRPPVAAVGAVGNTGTPPEITEFVRFFDMIRSNNTWGEIQQIRFNFNSGMGPLGELGGYLGNCLRDCNQDTLTNGKILDLIVKAGNNLTLSETDIEFLKGNRENCVKITGTEYTNPFNFQQQFATVTAAIQDKTNSFARSIAVEKIEQSLFKECSIGDPVLLNTGTETSKAAAWMEVEETMRIFLSQMKEKIDLYLDLRDEIQRCILKTILKNKRFKSPGAPEIRALNEIEIYVESVLINPMPGLSDQTHQVINRLYRSDRSSAGGSRTIDMVVLPFFSESEAGGGAQRLMGWGAAHLASMVGPEAKERAAALSDTQNYHKLDGGSLRIIEQIFGLSIKCFDSGGTFLPGVSLKKGSENNRPFYEPIIPINEMAAIETIKTSLVDDRISLSKSVQLDSIPITQVRGEEEREEEEREEEDQRRAGGAPELPIFVVSHGSFMKNLWRELYTIAHRTAGNHLADPRQRDISVYNLDIILLYTHNPGGGQRGRNIHMELFRFPSYFGLYEKLTSIPATEKIYIIMRHCPACHNLKGGTLNHHITSGILSLCIGITPHWFMCANLDPIFAACEQKGGILFAGSNIYRSILTCSMVIERYKIYKNPSFGPVMFFDDPHSRQGIEADEDATTGGSVAVDESVAGESQAKVRSV